MVSYVTVVTPNPNSATVNILTHGSFETAERISAGYIVPAEL